MPQNAIYCLHFVDVSRTKVAITKYYAYIVQFLTRYVGCHVVPQPKEEKEEEDEILTELMRKQAELKAVVSDLGNELDVLVMYWT